MGQFLRELRRRRVFRVAAIYIVGAWVVIQVAGEVFEAWNIPGQALRYIWIATILGFPLALVFGWRFDIVGGRVVRTGAADASDDDDYTLQRVDYIVLAALTAIGGAIAYGLVTQVTETPLQRTEIDAGEFDPKSIAVLPFENISGDEQNMPFTMGIHDDILTQVSKIRDLKVISRTSVARLDTDMSIRDIGKLLGVASVLEGGVQRVGNNLRVNAQLIDAKTDSHLWAATFDKELSTRNIFTIQSEIAEAIAAALLTTLSPREQQNIRKLPTHSFEAYEAYLLGNQEKILRTAASLAEAVNYFSKAIELDADYALAYVGLADTTLLLNSYGDLTSAEAVERSGPLLARALELDDQLAAAHASTGLRFANQGRPDEAIMAYQRAIELDPNYAPAYHWYGELLVNRVLRPTDALPLLEKARELDPLSPVISATLGEAYEGLGRFDDAMEIYRRVLSREPAYPGSYYLIGTLYRYGYGRLDQGVRWYLEELEIDPSRPASALAYAYIDLRDVSRAEYWFERSLASHPDQFWSVAGMSYLHRYRGENEESLRYARQLDQIAPGNNISLATLVFLGHEQEALQNFRRHNPQFSCIEPALDQRNVFHAINISLAMERTGDTECAKRLLVAALETIHTMSRMGGLGYGLADVEIYARQGRKELALKTLRQAIDEGLRAQWWAQGEGSPHNASIANEPEFIAMMNEIKADLTIQLENVRRIEAGAEQQ